MTPWVPAVLALALLTVLPGPDVAVVTRVALARGRAAALRASFGIVTGLLTWGALTVAGLAALLAASAAAYAVVRLAGAAYLVWLGVVALLRPAGDGDSATPAGVRHPYRTGLLSNLLNPKIAVFYTSLLPNLVPGGGPGTLVALVLVHVALSLAWLAAYAALLARTSGVLRRPRVRRALERLTGLVLVAFGVRVAAAARR